MLVVSPPSVATSPPVKPNLPRRRLYDLLGCSLGDGSVVLCLRGDDFLPSLSWFTSASFFGYHSLHYCFL